MKSYFDLSSLEWRLSGWTPEYWRMQQTMEIGETPLSEVPAIKVKVPCSVQKALLDAGYIEDWNVGTNYRKIEWIEHREWLFDAEIPDEVFADKSKTYYLNCEGLDFSGDIFFNGKLIYSFANSYMPVKAELKCPRDSRNWIRIAFTCKAPAWQGQFGRTSQMTVPKCRFYYSWDWTCRMVQTGIWDRIYISAVDKTPIEYLDVDADADIDNGKGILDITASFAEPVSYTARAVLSREGKTVYAEEKRFEGYSVSMNWSGFDVRLWHCNLNGEQPLYDLEYTVEDADGTPVDRITRRVGFRHIDWEQTEGAYEFAGSWICLVNGVRTFIQGCDWVPPYMNFADCGYKEYKELIDVYKDLGINLLRVWGGAVLPHEEFYDLCDEAGIMVWQEFPLSSSGIDNEPPFDKEFCDTIARVAETYIRRRKHHASLIIWCGGNELASAGDIGEYRATTIEHPMIRNFMNICKSMDPRRRFLNTSPCGIKIYTNDKTRGRGIIENIHGPWKADRIEDWNRLFENDESMFRAETGAPGASSKDILDAYAGELKPWPMENANVYWSRPYTWWLEIDIFKRETGKDAESVEEYVDWSQKRQAELLVKAVGTYKKNFGKHGGFIIWMGHDCYPCPANTSIIDYYRRPKPAALALKEKVFLRKPEEIDV